MMTRLTAAALAAAALALAGTAGAQDAEDLAEMRVKSKAAGLISPEEAIEKALAAKPGTVTDADLDRSFRKYYYEVEIIDAQGDEWEVKIDAKTGEVRRVSKDWF